jgi:hypothetical protein
MDGKNYPPKENGYNEVKLLKETLQLMMTQMGQLSMELKKSRLAPDQIICREWMTGEEVVRALRISPRKLQTLRDNGMLPYTRFDNKIYYRMSDVRQLLEKGYNG